MYVANLPAIELIQRFAGDSAAEPARRLDLKAGAAATYAERGGARFLLPMAQQHSQRCGRIGQGTRQVQGAGRRDERSSGASGQPQGRRRQSLSARPTQLSGDSGGGNPKHPDRLLPFCLAAIAP